MINLKNFAGILSLPVFSTLILVSPSYAFKLTFQPTGDIVKTPQENVEFLLFMSDFKGKTLNQLTFIFDFDDTEIVNPNVKSAPNSGGVVTKNHQKSYTIIGLNEKNPGDGLVPVGSVSFSVVKSIQDFQRDFWLIGAIADTNPENPENLGYTSPYPFLNTESVDIGPETANIIPANTSVPEPLTILGSLTALGLGTLLKRKYSQKVDKKTF